jgi:hypothetical protein
MSTGKQIKLKKAVYIDRFREAYIMGQYADFIERALS